VEKYRGSRRMVVPAGVLSLTLGACGGEGLDGRGLCIDGAQQQQLLSSGARPGGTEAGNEANAATDPTSTLTPAQRMELLAIVQMIREGQTGGALEKPWSAFVAQVAPQAGTVDWNALVSLVLRESYADVNDDVRYYAARVESFSELRKQLLDDRERALSASSENGAPAHDELIAEPYWTVPGLHANAIQPRPTTKAPTTLNSKAERENYVRDLDDKLNSVGDDAQLANVDLHNALQRQEQTLQTISNISKMLYDTAMAVIRRIGG
jgi:hypothetical protein